MCIYLSIYLGNRGVACAHVVGAVGVGGGVQLQGTFAERRDVILPPFSSLCFHTNVSHARIVNVCVCMCVCVYVCVCVHGGDVHAVEC